MDASRSFKAAWRCCADDVVLLLGVVGPLVLGFEILFEVLDPFPHLVEGVAASRGRFRAGRILCGRLGVRPLFGKRRLGIGNEPGGGAGRLGFDTNFLLKLGDALLGFFRAVRDDQRLPVGAVLGDFVQQGEGVPVFGERHPVVFVRLEFLAGLHIEIGIQEHVGGVARFRREQGRGRRSQQKNEEENRRAPHRGRDFTAVQNSLQMIPRKGNPLIAATLQQENIMPAAIDTPGPGC